MTTDKDKPQHRGIPATQNDQAVKEAFTRLVENDNTGPHTGIAAKTALENKRRAEALLRSVKPKR